MLFCHSSNFSFLSGHSLAAGRVTLAGREKIRKNFRRFVSFDLFFTLLKHSDEAQKRKKILSRENSHKKNAKSLSIRKVFEVKLKLLIMILFVVSSWLWVSFVFRFFMPLPLLLTLSMHTSPRCCVCTWKMKYFVNISKFCPLPWTALFSAESRRPQKEKLTKSLFNNFNSLNHRQSQHTQTQKMALKSSTEHVRKTAAPSKRRKKSLNNPKEDKYTKHDVGDLATHEWAKERKNFTSLQCVLFLVRSEHTLTAQNFWFIESLLLLNLNGTESEHERKNLSE